MQSKRLTETYLLGAGDIMNALYEKYSYANKYTKIWLISTQLGTVLKNNEFLYKRKMWYLIWVEFPIDTCFKHWMQ